MNKLILLSAILTILFYGFNNLKPDYIKAIEQTTDACTIDMQQNKNLICD